MVIVNNAQKNHLNAQDIRHKSNLKVVKAIRVHEFQYIDANKTSLVCLMVSQCITVTS